MINIYPSLIAADLMNLQKEIKTLEPHCAGYHIDIMDNHFVPNLTWGQMFVDAIGKITDKPLCVHLMIDNPESFVSEIFSDNLSLSAKNIVSFHIESVLDVKNICIRIQDKNCVPSIAVSPKTPIEKVFPFLSLVDHILIMAVEPGFSGQCFLKSSINKIDTLFAYCQTNNLQIKIGVDGGVGRENIGELAKMGVDSFAIGSGIFGYENRVEAIEILQKLAEK